MYGRPPCKIRRSGREKRSFDARAGPSRMASSFLPASTVRFPQRFAGQKKNREKRKKVLTLAAEAGILSERLTGGQEKEGNGRERPGGSRTDF